MRVALVSCSGDLNPMSGSASTLLRIAAGGAVYLGWSLLPFRGYAIAAQAWDLFAVIGVTAVLGAVYVCADWFVVQRKREPRAAVAMVLRTALGAGVLLAWVGLVCQALFVRLELLPIAFFDEPGPDESGFWFALLDRLVMSPLVEEILFRAWLLGSAWRARSLWLRLAISCLVFPFGHLWFDPAQPQEHVLQVWRMLLLVISSVGFTWVWFRTRSLLACFLTHAFLNAVPTLPWWLDG